MHCCAAVATTREYLHKQELQHCCSGGMCTVMVLMQQSMHTCAAHLQHWVHVLHVHAISAAPVLSCIDWHVGNS
jgi:hypothetical protein